MARTRAFVHALLALACVLFVGGRARAQACCAGSAALTPGRLALHEDALVGLQLRAATVLGSFDDRARYTAEPSGANEQDFEQDLFGAVRVLRQGQVALLLPFVETRRQAPGVTDFGGGLGDANLSLRYDFVFAGESRFVPGIAALVGLTAPTGRPPDAAHNVLATDATGVGAWQGNVGLAFEQTFGPWLVNATELLAWRAPRAVQGVDEALGTQLVTLLGGAYTFRSEAAVAVFASYTLEGAATLNDAPAPASARHIGLLGFSGIVPISDALRVQGSVFANPPVSGLGRNQAATGGLTLTLIWSWS